MKRTQRLEPCRLCSLASHASARLARPVTDRGGCPVVVAGDGDCCQQPGRVQQGVPLPPVHLLVGVVPARLSTLTSLARTDWVPMLPMGSAYALFVAASGARRTWHAADTGSGLGDRDQIPVEEPDPGLDHQYECGVPVAVGGHRVGAVPRAGAPGTADRPEPWAPAEDVGERTAVGRSAQLARARIRSRDFWARISNIRRQKPGTVEI